MSKSVWIVLQHRDGQLARMSWETLAAGQALAQTLGAKAEAIVLGAEVADLANEVAALDLAGVRVAEHPDLATYTPGAYIGALAPAIAGEAPDFVLFPHSYQSVDYVPRLALAAGAGLLPEATAFESGADGLLWQRPVLGGKMVARVRLRGEGPVLVSMQSGAFSAEDVRRREAGSSEVRPLELEASGVVADREILRIEEAAANQVDLTKAEVIVAVGRGVGGADKLGPAKDLATALGAELAASRPVIDNGWLPRDRQIGSSGQTVAPKLYVALGISGAIQHLVGMKGSKVVVAVNKDRNAPIFNVADYGVVGDLHEVVPALAEAVRQAGS